MSYQDTVNTIVQSLNAQARAAAEDAVKQPSKKKTRYRWVEGWPQAYSVPNTWWHDPDVDWRPHGNLTEEDLAYGEEKLEEQRDAWVQSNYGNRLAGAQFMRTQAEEYEQMKQDADADREDILGEIEAWGAGLNESFVETGVAQERAAWEGKLAQAREQLQNNAAAQGRTLSPWLMSEVTGRIAAQANEAISLRRMELERALADRKMQYIQAKDSVYSNTDRRMMDPMQAYALMQQLGAADAD